MKLPHLYLGLLTALLPLAAVGDTLVPATTYASGQPVVVFDPATITNEGNAITVTSGATVIFQAGTRIRLKPGFHAVAGARFYAAIGSTVDSDGDGLPDVWARAHGGVVGSAQTPHGGSLGLTYLSEYLLGTNPSIGKQSDDGNSTQLKINRPVQ